MNRNNISEYIVQIVIVIFGVFLGMMLNEWNSGRKDTNEQSIVLQQLMDETQEHNAKMNEVIQYHKELILVVDSIMRNGDVGLLSKPFFTNGAWSQVPKFKGIQVFPMHTSAYETAKISNVLSKIEPELLGEISSYYELIQLYNQFSDHMTALTFNFNSDTKFIDALFNVMIIKDDLLGYETRIYSESKELGMKIKESL